MDEQYLEVMGAAFREELQKIADAKAKEAAEKSCKHSTPACKECCAK